MDWIAIAGAVGLGALIGKIIDVTWLESRTREREKIHWLRTERLQAYSALARELRSYGYDNRENAHVSTALALAAEVEMLTTDQETNAELRGVVSKLNDIHSITERRESTEADLKRLGDLMGEIDDATTPIIDKLRGHLLD